MTQIITKLFPCLIAAGFVTAAPVFAATPDDDLSRHLDDFFQTHLENIAAPGFSVSVVRGEEVIFSKGYGVVTAGEETPLGDDTILAIGSLTKSFTAMAIMQLEEQGLLELDDPVVKYLPWFRSADKTLSDTITLRMCLNNTTGLAASFTTIMQNQSQDADALEMGVRALSSYQMTREPGQSFEYLNEGWNVLGLIIEKLSGISWEQYIAQNIFLPLEMDRSSSERKVLENWQISTGHYSGIRPEPAAFIHIQGSLPAGSGFYASVRNLGNYMVALLSEGRFGQEQLLSADSLKSMWRPAASMRVLPYEMGGTGEPAHYGMGWIVMELDGKTYIGHGGEFRTMSSLVLLDPESRLGVALLYNTGELDGYTSQSSQYAAYNALRIVNELPLSDYGIPREKDPTLNDYRPEPELLAHTGTYLSDSGSRLDISAGGSEGLQAFLVESIYPADFDVDFVNQTNFVLRNIAGTKNGYFVQTGTGVVTEVNVGGQPFRRKREMDGDRFQTHQAGSPAISFQLPVDWRVDDQEHGFMASAGGEATQWLVGEVTTDTFDGWLGSIEQKAVGARPAETREFRNGYFYRGVSYRLDSNGDRRNALSLYVSNRGVSYVFTLSVSDGELTQAIIGILNPFLDSLYLP
jgi:CubicO group peptidase (beta-lactamase class C family)